MTWTINSGHVTRLSLVPIDKATSEKRGRTVIKENIDQSVGTVTVPLSSTIGYEDTSDFTFVVYEDEGDEPSRTANVEPFSTYHSNNNSNNRNINNNNNNNRSNNNNNNNNRNINNNNNNNNNRN